MMALWVNNLVMASVVLLMLGVGLRTTFGQVIDVAKRFQLLMRGLFANFIVVPVVFYLGVQCVALSTDVEVGIIIMAAVPIAPMAPPFVGMAKGDLAYAVGLMTIVALLCVPLTPLILALCLPTTEKGLELDTLQIIKTLLKAQLIPVFLGMTIHHLSRAWTDRLLKFIPKMGQVGLVISIILILTVQAKQMVDLGSLANLVIVLSIVVSLFIGDWMMMGQTGAMRRSLAISTAIRNVALGLLIVTANFRGTPTVAVVLVSGVVSMVVAFVYGKLTVRSETQTSIA